MANDRGRSKPPGRTEGRPNGKKSNGNGNGSRRLVEPVSGSIGRRDFVTIAGLTLPFASFLEACSPDSGAASTESDLIIEGDLPIDFSLSAIRKEDFLIVRFDFINLVPDRHRRHLERKHHNKPAFILLNFQSQSIFEASFFEGAVDVLEPPPLPVESVLSGPSRLSFQVPFGVRQIPMSLEGLLELVTRSELHVSLNALPAGERSVTQVVPSNLPPRGGHGPWHSTRWLRRARHHFAQRFFHRHPPPPPPETETLNAGIPRLPFNHETSLEVPFRLIISPNRHGAWAHASEPVTSRQSHRTELWHTRLGIRAADGSIDERDPTNRTIRALWTRDSVFKPDDPFATGEVAEPPSGTPDTDPATPDPDKPFFDTGVLESLTGTVRSKLVHLTSNFRDFQDLTDDNGEIIVRPTPIDVNLLMLSSVGNWLDSKVKFEGPSLGLASWEHRSTMGRDHYDKVVFKGFLYPFGHRAELIRITERKLKPNHPHIAYLRTRYFIVVREPEKEFKNGRDSSVLQTAGALRQLPFESILIDTLVTPNLDVPDRAQNGDESFVPRFGGTRSGMDFTTGEAFKFDMRALDVEGSIISFSAPVVWVPVDINGDQNDVNTEKRPLQTADGIPLAVDLYDEESTELHHLTFDEKNLPLKGQRIAYADAIKPDDTSYETESLIFDAKTSLGGTDGGLENGYPTFVPFIDNARVAVDALRHIGGDNAATRDFAYHQAFIENGFGNGGATNTANAGDLLLQLNDTLPFEVEYDEKSDKSGGFVSPNTRVAALSRSIGVVSAKEVASSDPERLAFADAEAALGNFDPTEFLGFLDGALLFGVFPLSDILLDGLNLDAAPKYLTQVVSGALGAFADAERLLNDLQNLPAGLQTAVNPIVTAIQTLQGHVETALDGDADEADRQAALAAIPGDIGSIATALNGLATALDNASAATQIQAALIENLVRRAAAVATALQSTAGQIVQQLTNLAQLAEFPKEIRTSLQWRGTVKRKTFLATFVPFRLDGTPVETDDEGVESLLLTVDIRARTDAATPPQVDISCALENFRIDLFGSDAPGDPFQFLRLRFGRIVFKIENLKKPDIMVDFDPLGGIEFVGPLSFIQSLKDSIPLDAFSDPPSIEITPEGLIAGISLPIPNLAVGAMSLENILLAAAVKIPFIGDPLSFRFSFSTRENPFGLTIILLGGGGFFAIEIDCDGVKLLEASLEAGARIAIDFAVVSGLIEAMLGIYFRWEKAPGQEKNQVSLTGYFRLRGAVDVLGLISASITCTLELTYEFPPANTLTGQATVEIEVDILFFSATVSFTVKKQLPGAITNALPVPFAQGARGGRRLVTGETPFITIMKPEGNLKPWDEYLEAFAA